MNIVKYILRVKIQRIYYELGKLKIDELVYDPRSYYLYIGDDQTPGGIPVHTDWINVDRVPYRAGQKVINSAGQHYIKFSGKILDRNRKPTINYTPQLNACSGRRKIEVIWLSQDTEGITIYVNAPCTLFYIAWLNN